MQLSVVIPTHDRVDTLHRVLAAYEAQTPHDLAFEVVVVDDGSRDATPELLAGYRPSRYPLRFSVEENRGPARARNRALELAAGELVLFTGDDVEPAPDLLAEHLRGHRAAADPAVAVLGLTAWPPGEDTTATMRHVDGPGAQQFSYHYFKDGAEYDFRHLYTSNVSLRRDLLAREPGPFSTDFPAAAFEDAELGYRLARRGLRIVYRAAARAFHHHPYGAAAFFRRQLRCGEMGALLYRKLPELRQYLDLDTLEDRRLALLTAALPAGVPAPAALAELEQRALRLAGFFDPLPFDAVDELLHPLFRHGYLKGLAGALYGETAPRLASRLFGELVIPGVRRLAARIERAGLPYPAADLAALVAAGDGGAGAVRGRPKKEAHELCRYVVSPRPPALRTALLSG